MAIARRTYKKKAYKSKPKVAKVSRAVKSYVAHKIKRPEMKQIQGNVVEDTQLVTSSAAGSLVWQEVMNPTQGTTRDTRQGNQVYFHGFHAKGSFHNNGTVPAYVRRLVVGYSTAITVGAAAELFDNGVGAGVSVTTTGPTMALITNKINKVQFKVYSDKTIRLSSSTATDGSQTRMYNYFTKFGGKKITFEATTAGQSNQDWRCAEIYLVAQADNDAAAGITVERTENYSVYFTDI